ncbi:unnamed protein product [Boreogadus saida]
MMGRVDCLWASQGRGSPGLGGESDSVLTVATLSPPSEGEREEGDLVSPPSVNVVYTTSGATPSSCAALPGHRDDDVCLCHRHLTAVFAP